MKVATLIAICASLSGCAGERKTPDPVGIGTGVHELKQSPCACTEIQQHVPLNAEG